MKHWGWIGGDGLEGGYTGGMRGTRAKGWNPAEAGESVMMGNGGRLWEEGEHHLGTPGRFSVRAAGASRFLVSFYAGRTERREC